MFPRPYVPNLFIFGGDSEFGTWVLGNIGPWEHRPLGTWALGNMGPLDNLGIEGHIMMNGDILGYFEIKGDF